jgi:hypothetical protein
MTQSIDELEARWVAGVEWLTAHDESGAFHFWYTAGIRPEHKKPVQSDERSRAYKVYYDARELWERLDRRLSRLAKEASQ